MTDIDQIIKSFMNSLGSVDDQEPPSNSDPIIPNDEARLIDHTTEAAQNANKAFDTQFPNADVANAVAAGNAGTAPMPDVPVAGNIPGTPGSPLGTQIPDGNVPVSPEPAQAQDPLAALRAQAASSMPQQAPAAQGQNPLDVLKQLAQQQVTQNAPGGSQSVAAMNNAQNALAPVNAAAAFGQNQMKGAGTMMGPVANPSSASDAAGFNGDFAKQGAQLQNNMNNVQGAMNTSLGAQMQQDLLGGGAGGSKGGVNGLFSSLQSMPPDKQYPILMQMSMTPSLAPIAKMLLESPSMTAYAAQSVAAGTEQGKAQVGASIAATSAGTMGNVVLTNLDSLDKLNKDTSSILPGLQEKAAGLTGGGILGKNAANIGTWNTTVNNNILAELNNMQASMANPESTATPALRANMVDIAEKAKAIDVSHSPEERTAEIDAVRTSIKQMMESADYKAWAVGGNKPPVDPNAPTNSVNNPAPAKTASTGSLADQIKAELARRKAQG